jgi:adenosylcobinamide-GDP ribazoletransferase
MNWLRREVRLLTAAFSFFTRVRLNGAASVTPDELRAAARYFPVIGWFVGGLGAAVWWLAQRVWPSDVAVVLSIGATVLVTGAMHEDAFTDVCDGFGGAHERSRVLAIMHDSRVGAFGVIGIVLLLGLKALALAHVPTTWMIATLVAGHTVSRWAALTIMTTEVYVREEPDAKARPMAAPFQGGALLFATVAGIAPLFLLPPRFAVAMIGLVAARWLLGRWFRQRLGGYTGDCLGATQQLSEVVFYLSVLALA